MTSINRQFDVIYLTINVNGRIAVLCYRHSHVCVYSHWHAGSQQIQYFVWSCLISHLLEARGKHFWFEAIDIIVLEGGQDICIVGVSCGYLEVVIVNSKISGECVEELIVFGGDCVLLIIIVNVGLISTRR